MQVLEYSQFLSLSVPCKHLKKYIYRPKIVVFKVTDDIDRPANKSNLKNVHTKQAKIIKVKLGYNEQLGTGQICSLQPGFVIVGLIYVVKWSFGTEFLFIITKCSL